MRCSSGGDFAANIGQWAIRLGKTGPAESRRSAASDCPTAKLHPVSLVEISITSSLYIDQAWSAVDGQNQSDQYMVYPSEMLC
jgi:hypothetical protein